MAQTGAVSVPYLNAYGSITKVLGKIKSASTPSRFTQDFLSTKLGLKGGSYKPLIPFLKRTGFLSSDGTPTDLYKQFRNDALSKSAAGRALKAGYSSLYEVNEYAHDLNDKDLKGIVVQVTGLDAGSSTVKGIIGSFKALKALASFDAADEEAEIEEEQQQDTDVEQTPKKKDRENAKVDLRLGYTINLNLPATSDIAVFNAIFKSLRDNLID